MYKTADKSFLRVKYKYDPERSQDKTIRYYQSFNSYKSFDNMLEPLIRIEYDKGRYNQQIDSKYMLYFRTNKNWRKSYKTGLVRVGRSWCFFGDIPEIMKFKTYHGEKWLGNPKDFVLIQFASDTYTIVVDVFKNFYPYGIAIRDQFIKEHRFEYKKRDSIESLNVV